MRESRIYMNLLSMVILFWTLTNQNLEFRKIHHRFFWISGVWLVVVLFGFPFISHSWMIILISILLLWPRCLHESNSRVNVWTKLGGKSVGFPRTSIYKWWCFHIYVSLPQGIYWYTSISMYTASSPEKKDAGDHLYK